MAAVVNVNDLLDDHVSLDLECLDRIYLNAYVPNLQVAGQVVAFMRDHLKKPIPSPSVMEKMGNRFREAVTTFADVHDIPVIRFKKGDRHIDLMRPYLEAATAPAVVAIGVAQEFQSVFAASRRDTPTGAPFFSFYKADRRVTAYYFYVNDADFGHGFIKICAYFPYPAKVWVNGHEWAKRQAQQRGLEYTELANGFASCSDPAQLQTICDHLGPNQIQSFFERWMGVVPTPLEESDRTAGFWWELSMRQIEVSRTLVFDAVTPAADRSRIWRFIEKESAHFAITTLCGVCRVSRSAYYEWINKGEGPSEADLDEAILANKIYDAWLKEPPALRRSSDHRCPVQRRRPGQREAGSPPHGPARHRRHLRTQEDQDDPAGPVAPTRGRPGRTGLQRRGTR